MRWVLACVLLASCAPRRDVRGDLYATVGARELREPDAQLPLATGEHVLSLEGATVMVLERNADLAVRRLDPALAEAFEAAERAEFGATVFADGQYRHELARETNRATMMQFDVEGSNTDVVLGVRQRTPTGTTVETSLGFRRDESNRAPEQQEVRAGITLTQSLLRGLRPEVNLASIRQAEMETRATRHQLRAFASALLVDLETTYWQLALARRSVGIYERSLEVIEQEVEAVGVRIEVGDLAPSDVWVVRSQAARRRQELIDARARVQTLELQMARMLRLDPHAATVTLTDAVDIEPSGAEDPGAHHELALKSRPDLAEARVRLEQSELDVLVTSAGLLPRLDVFVQLTKTGFGSSFGDAVSAIQRPTYELTAGLSFEQLLGNGAARALDRRSNLLRERGERAVENLASLVLLDVALALTEIDRARSQIAASREAAALLAQVLGAESERLELGESTALLVAQAERDFVEAEVAAVEATVAYRIGLVRLYAAEGTLLERRGVQLGVQLDDP